MDETVSTVSGETIAVLECLKIVAPGVKWNHALASTFERMLLKRGYAIREATLTITPVKDETE